MPDDFAASFAARLADPMPGQALFDHVPDIVYFVKDERCRYVTVNQTLTDRCGAGNKSELIGKTATEAFGAEFGLRFLEQDQAVIAGHEPLVNELERHVYAWQESGWCLTTKLPLMDRGGQVCGLVGMSRDLQSPGEDARDFGRLCEVVSYIKNNLAGSLRPSGLAEQVEMSAYQLDRRCREVYGISPAQLILQLRMESAANKLRQTGQAIVEIAFEVGYSDQSAFSRQFRRTFGVSPGKFRG